MKEASNTSYSVNPEYITYITVKIDWLILLIHGYTWIYRLHMQKVSITLF